ncbi:hypothetical protein TWF281_004848 [Arthrobotrys megalospora]
MVDRRMDQLPPEVILQVFKYFDRYTVLAYLRPVCKSWAYASDIQNPSRRIVGLPPAIWEGIFSYTMTYKTIHAISQTCTSLRSLTKTSRFSPLQGVTFQLPASAVPNVPRPIPKMAQHPAFESICCRIETGSLIYHRTGNCCPNDVLSFPMAQENATNPPISKILLKFTAKYGVTLRPVLITKPIGGNQRGVTVGDIYKAMQRLFSEPLTAQQILVIRQLRDWENRKHKASKSESPKIEREPEEDASSTAEGATSGSDRPPLEPEPEKQPVFEHDESLIHLEYPFVTDSFTHIHGPARQQREFLHDFPYVYASAHVGGVQNGVQLFTLTYH